MKINGNLEGRKNIFKGKKNNNYGTLWKVVKGLNMHTTRTVFKIIISLASKSELSEISCNVPHQVHFHATHLRCNTEGCSDPPESVLSIYSNSVILTPWGSTVHNSSI